jgi:hypothetical protein
MGQSELFVARSLRFAADFEGVVIGFRCCSQVRCTPEQKAVGGAREAEQEMKQETDFSITIETSIFQYFGLEIKIANKTI